MGDPGDFKIRPAAVELGSIDSATGLGKSAKPNA
jgi:hypothetical protein